MAISIGFDVVTVIGMHSIFQYCSRFEKRRARRFGFVMSMTMIFVVYGAFAVVPTLLIKQVMAAIIRSVGG